MRNLHKIFTITTFVCLPLIYGCQRERKKENSSQETPFLKTQKQNSEENFDLPEDHFLPESPTLPSFEPFEEERHYSPMDPHEAPKWSPRVGGQ